MSGEETTGAGDEAPAPVPQGDGDSGTKDEPEAGAEK